MTTSKYSENPFKSACSRGQSWINDRVEKMAHHTNNFSTFKSGYSKIQPRIFPKGLSTFKKENGNDFDDEECDNFLKNPRSRVHSIDVIDNKVRDALRQQFDERSYINFEPKGLTDLPELNENNNCEGNTNETNTKEAMLTTSSMELKLIDVIATPKRCNRVNKRQLKFKQEKIYIKSSDNDNEEDIKIIPSVLLTYHAKYTNIKSNANSY